MKKRHFRKSLLGDVAKGMLGTAALVGWSGHAQANSICTADTSTNPQTFSCTDATGSPPSTGTGTFSVGATFTAGINGAVEIASSGALDVSVSGQITATEEVDTISTVYVTAAGPLTYTNLGTTSGYTTGWLFNTYLRSDESIVANTGNVVGDGYRATGVFSETMNGNNTLTGGNTSVTGVWSRGLWSDAYNGTNVTNTGVVTAIGELSRGVIARALPSGDCTFPGDLSTTVNVTGNVTADYVGVTTLTCGNSMVNVQAGTTVAVTGTEGMAILNIGSNSANTNIDGSVLAASSSGRALDVRDGSSVTNIGEGGVMSGTFDGDVGADSLVIAAGGTWTSSGTSDFQTGNDSISNNGTINADAATFANLATFTNSGVLSLSGGSFALTGSTAFTNNGIIRVAPGTTTITSDSALYNNGAIDMQNGVVGDVLTISNNYVAGANASFLLDVSESASDMFVVNGTSQGSSGMRSAAETSNHGTTQIFLNAAAEINTNAILIGTTQKGFNFAVGNQASRLIDLRMSQIGNALYISALPNPVAFQPLLVGAVAKDVWYQSAGAVSSNAAMLRGLMASDRKRKVSLWGQLYAGRESYGERSTQTAFGSDVVTDNRARTDRTGAQLGLDVMLGKDIVAGFTGGYEKAKADHRSLDGSVKTNGFNVGAYAHVGGSVGFHANMLVKYDRSDARLTNNAFDTRSGNPDFNAFGGEVAVGYVWQSNAIRFELGASMSYVRTSIDSFSAEGIDYNFDRIESFRGSLDARAEFGSGKVVPFLNVRLLQEFNGASKLTLASGDEVDDVKAKGGRTWARLEAGLSGKGSGPLLSGWAEIGEVRGFGVRGGWRF